MVELKAYVTGADRGLGFSLTKILLKNNYTVFAGKYLNDWHDLNRLKEEYPDKLKMLPLDLANDESVYKAAKIIKEQTEYLDLIINNAAVYLDDGEDVLGDLKFDSMRRMYEINTLGPLKVTNSVIDLLINGKKKILLNISSEAGSIGDCWRKREFGYAMSKSALNMQTAILKNHLEEYGIRILLLHPGYLKTYMLGKKNMDADIEADESAINIYKLLQDENNYTDLYYDYQGNLLPW
ncbi:MAG: SDR family NAD(P)-dependent oxidoreductase [Bacillota bacterium]